MLILLFVAQNLDVLVHEGSIGSTKDVTFFEILLLDTKESLCVEIFVGHQWIELAKVIAKVILTSLVVEFLEEAFALDAECKATEQRLNLQSGFVLLGTFLAIAPNFIYFLLVSYSADMTTQGCLQSDYLISFFCHATDERFLADALTDHIVLDR